jgi:NADH-quinone oxidoreductase subunit M
VEVEESVTELRGRELLAVGALLSVIIALGFVPQVALDVINPAVDRTMQSTGMTDPEPSTPVAESVEVSK